jgi:spermidine synthase
LEPQQPPARAEVRWVEDVDFWIVQAIHAGSGKRSTASPAKRRKGGAAAPSSAAVAAPEVAGSDARHNARHDAEQDDECENTAPGLDLPGATLSEFDGVRYLHLGDTPWVQGAMRLRKSDVIELDYVQRMCAWLLWRSAEPGLRAAQLGLGAAALTRFCHGPLGLHTTAVEINAQVVAACRSWFKLPPDGERLQVVVSDAGTWIAEPARAASLDVINIDLYDHQAAAPVLDDAEFYAACHAALAPGGFMTVNLFGRKASFARSAERIAAVFGAPHCAMLLPTAEGNTIVVARRAEAGSPGLPGLSDSDVDARAALVERATDIAWQHGLPAARWLKLLRPLIGPNGKPSALKPDKVGAKVDKPGTARTSRASAAPATRPGAKTAAKARA